MYFSRRRIETNIVNVIVCNARTNLEILLERLSACTFLTYFNSLFGIGGL